MRTISKLSLVAALAVAGFSTANAKPLEEAIKDVDVSGSVVYRYNDYRNDVTKTSSINNNYKVGLNLSSKVNDFTKFNSRFLVAGGDLGLATLNTQTVGDVDPMVTLSHAYFGLTAIKNTTINVGKQGLTTPWTTAIDSDGNEQTGTGALALSTWGPVTLAAGYFNQTNLDASGDVGGLNGANDIGVLAAIGKFGPINADIWFADMQQTLHTFTVGVNGKFGSKTSNFGFDARYVDLVLRGKNDSNTLIKLVLTGKMNIVNAKLAYGTTSDKGGTTAFDNDAKTTMIGWNTNINNKLDAKYLQTTLGVDILSNLNLSANYNTLEHKVLGATIEEDELYGQLVYKMSNNLSTYIRYGTYTRDNKVGGTKTKLNDDTRGRLQVEYTF